MQRSASLAVTTRVLALALALLPAARHHMRLAGRADSRANEQPCPPSQKTGQWTSALVSAVRHGGPLLRSVTG